MFQWLKSAIKGGDSSGSAPAHQRALTLESLFAGAETDLDDVVPSEDQALRVAAVYACVKVIAETVSTLPLHLMRRDGKASIREGKHRTAGWLMDAPNGKMTWPEAREAVAASCVLRGNGFAGVGWQGGFPVSFLPWLIDCVMVSQDDKTLVYSYYTEDGERIIRPPEVAHFKGLSFSGLLGISPISACSYSVSAAKAQAELGYNTFSNGARFTGILAIPRGAFKDDTTRAALRQEWQTQIGVAREGTGTAILTEGIDYKPISMSLGDAQFIEAMKFSIEEIARIFRVPLHKIQHLDRATNNNIEHQSLEFHRDTILPWLIRIESVLDRVLLTEGDRRAGYFFRHNVDGILRGDFNTRMQGYKDAISTGIMTRNEVREKEKLAPYEGGDRPLVPLNMGGSPAPGQEGTGNKRDDSPVPSLSPLTPMLPLIADALRAMEEREKKAFARARGKDDEGDRLEKFLGDHKRAASERLAPAMDAVRMLGYRVPEGFEAAIGAAIAEGASKRFAAKQEPHITAEKIIEIIKETHENEPE